MPSEPSNDLQRNLAVYRQPACFCPHCLPSTHPSRERAGSGVSACPLGCVVVHRRCYKRCYTCDSLPPGNDHGCLACAYSCAEVREQSINVRARPPVCIPVVTQFVTHLARRLHQIHPVRLRSSDHVVA